MPAKDKVWPALPYESWKESCATLHLWTQIVGKIRLAQTPWVNHSWHVPLYVTLGSPLGIDVVKRHIRPPALGKPAGVRHWLNGTDERDYVALVSRLDRNTFAVGIENLADIQNRQDDAHAIVDYLTDSTVAQRIHAALA